MDFFRRGSLGIHGGVLTTWLPIVFPAGVGESIATRGIVDTAGALPTPATGMIERIKMGKAYNNSVAGSLLRLGVGAAPSLLAGGVSISGFNNITLAGKFLVRS